MANLNSDISLGNRFTCLLRHAAQSLTLDKRRELMDQVEEWLEADHPAETHAELFYMLGSMAMIEMSNYAESLQMEIGTKILKEGLGESDVQR